MGPKMQFQFAKVSLAFNKAMVMFNVVLAVLSALVGLQVPLITVIATVLHSFGWILAYDSKEFLKKIHKLDENGNKNESKNS